MRALLAALLLAGTAGALPVASAAPALARAPETIAFDLRNCPDWRAIADLGYEAAILSARGKECGAADSLRARGVLVGYHLQPWLAAWDGGAETTFVLDRTLYRLASAAGAWLHDSTGAMPLVREPGITGMPYDFSHLDFAARFGQALAAYDSSASFWYFDYGDLKYGIGWVVSLGAVAPDLWPRWAEGYRAMARAANGRRVCFYGKGDDFVCPECDVYPFEGVGNRRGDLYRYDRTLVMCRAAERAGGRGLIFCQRADSAAHRRCLGAIARLTGAWFNWRNFAAAGGFDRNLPDPEHFELDLGVAADTIRQVAPDVWRRDWARGFVIANVGTAPYRLDASYTVGACDGLVAQTRDATGRPIEWRTNQGK
jgi:hypothetical protein